ncbi:methyltransferase [Daejeonella sp.]|uniref:tRNA1(Val) (adenine(37)-N6)-methyltransferase n=1 Tax=Daejeonella sp. TaxID=2805397 RepID=UPI0030C5A001
MSKVFQFKQFSVDQTNCGMKVNTDAALLGSIAHNDDIERILEIGTGTGVIALMLAQRYASALIDAVEIDDMAAETAELNFRNSPFAPKISLVRSSFEEHFSNTAAKYDLIVSNPPYFINSLRSDDPSRRLARHANEDFFKNLVSGVAAHLSSKGLLYLILPLDTAELVKTLLAQSGVRYRASPMLYQERAGKTPTLTQRAQSGPQRSQRKNRTKRLQQALCEKLCALCAGPLRPLRLNFGGYVSSSSIELAVRKTIFIHSFPESKPYRCILVIGIGARNTDTQKFVIYEAQNAYTEEYRMLLKDYLTIF